LVNLYPNPSSSEINVEFIVPESGNVEIVLFNDIGKKVDVLFNQVVNKGLTREKFVMAVYTNGIYFLELRFNGETIRKKVMVY